jgi:hypothetical protein
LLVALWAAALLFAFVNGVASLRRVIVLSQPQGTDPDGQATRSFASFLLCQTQPDTRVLLLLRHGDNTAPWFNYRLNYLAYPRRPDVAWDNFPPPTSDYDLVIAYRSAQKLPHPGWIRRLQQGNASLYTPQTPPAGTVLPLPLGPLSHAVGEGE